MGYLPIFLDVRRRRCLVVGGGEVAERRCRELLEAGAAVTVIAPGLTRWLKRQAAARRIEHVARAGAEDDIGGFAMVFAATSDADLQRRLAARARELSIPVNVADEPELCSFIMAAVVSRGDLKIAISTGGASPATARRIREELEARFGPEHGLALKVMRAARTYLRAHESNRERRADALTRLARSPLAEYLREGDLSAVDGLLRETLGRPASLKTLALDIAPSPPARSAAR